MSVSLQQTIKAFSAGGGRGHIDVTVNATNNGSEPVLNASDALGFLVRDAAGNQMPIHRIPPIGPDMGGIIQRGVSFDRRISFDTGPVDFGQEYTMTCRHMVTGDFDMRTFGFIHVYLETAGQPPFDQKS